MELVGSSVNRPMWARIGRGPVFVKFSTQKGLLGPRENRAGFGQNISFILKNKKEETDQKEVQTLK